MLSLEQTERVAEDVARLGPGDWSHLNGPARSLNLRQCLALPPTLIPEVEVHNGEGEDSGIPQEPGDCPTQYQSCISRIPGKDRCLQDKPNDCVKACVDGFGYDEGTCRASLCTPTERNIEGWTKGCTRATERSTATCLEERNACLAAKGGPEAFCPVLGSYLKAAADDFAELRGEPIGTSGASDSVALVLPGAAECQVHEAHSGKTSLICGFTETNSLEDSRREMFGLRDAIVKCVPDAKRTDFSQHEPNWVAEGADFLFRRGGTVCVGTYCGEGADKGCGTQISVGR